MFSHLKKSLPFFEPNFNPLPPEKTTELVSNRFSILMKVISTMVSFPGSWEKLQEFEKINSESKAFVMLDELADFITVREKQLLITNKSDGVYARWVSETNSWVREKN